MKTKIFVIALALTFAFLTTEARPKQHLPFAPKGKYGKLPTKKARPDNRKETWIYRQWGR